ncbi:MAG: hypothetical protein IKS69_07220 [Erysipelotrichaceae bacterium]|nr:hypothetical protein [Erysipelotrichaceae bacterium]
MKKVLIALLSLMFVLCLFGCDGGEKPAADVFDENELLKLLEDNSRFVDKENQLYVGFHKGQRSYDEMIKNSGYYLKMDITEIKKLEENKYQFTMHVPAFAGNEETDPYDAFDLLYTLTYDMNKPTEFDCLMESTDHSFSETYHFVSDKGLSQEELLKLLEDNSEFFCDETGTIAWFNAADKTYEETKDATSYYLNGMITSFAYLYGNEYELNVHVDGFAGNEMMDAYDPYDIRVLLTYDASSPKEYDVVMIYLNEGYSNYGHFVSVK